MKLSVIIPVYRVESTLNRCVESVLRQTLTDLEVILVDDGSPDRCPALCDHWAAADQRVRVVHQPNGGLSDARNTGIAMAQGEWLTFADSDDYLAADTYEQALAGADEADLVEFPFSRHHGAAGQQLVSFAPHTYATADDYWLNGHAYEHAYAWNKLYRRHLFCEVRFPKGRVFEDLWTLPAIMSQRPRIKTTGRGCYYYTHNPHGITQTAGAKELRSLLLAHLQAAKTNSWLNNDRYYMHVADIQANVSLLTGEPPLLPRRRVNPLADGLTPRQRLKALAADLFGLRATVNLLAVRQKLLRGKHKQNTSKTEQNRNKTELMRHT